MNTIGSILSIMIASMATINAFIFWKEVRHTVSKLELEKISKKWFYIWSILISIVLTTFILLNLFYFILWHPISLEIVSLLSVILLENILIQLFLHAHSYMVEEKAKISESMVIGLANIIEYKCSESGKHIKRVQEVTKMIINGLKKHTHLLDGYSKVQLKYMSYAAALHDIGKIGIPDNILLKSGKFESNEYEIMKKHSEIGFNMTKYFYMGENEDFVRFCGEVTKYHHEKWDGTGYPEHLKGEEIPITARIVTIADSFDAIVSKRIYKDSITIESGLEIIAQDKNTYFDPNIVDIFLSLENDLIDLYMNN